MKILSVFYNGNEIALHHNHFGKKKVYYNGHLVAEKWSFFSGKLSFTIKEDDVFVDYDVHFTYNNHGLYVGNIWRDYEPLVLTTQSYYQPKRPLEQYESDFV